MACPTCPAGKTDAVKALLKRGGATVDAADSSGNTALMQAAEGGAYLPNNGPMVQLLLDTGAKVGLQDSRGRPAVYRAESEGKEDANQRLLDKKADVNLADPGGNTL